MGGPRREGGRGPGDAARGARDRRPRRRQGSRIDRRLLRVRRGRSSGRSTASSTTLGVMPIGPFLDESDETARTIFDVNVHGVIAGTKAALRLMVPRGEGRIVNLASFAGPPRRPRPGDLCGEQGGGDRRHRGRGLGVRGLGRHGRRSPPVVHRHRADRGDRDAEDARRRSPPPRSPRRSSPRSATGPCSATSRGASARPARSSGRFPFAPSARFTARSGPTASSSTPTARGGADTSGGSTSKARRATARHDRDRGARHRRA